MRWTADTHPVTTGEAHAGLGWPGQAATAPSRRNASPNRHPTTTATSKVVGISVAIVKTTPTWSLPADRGVGRTHEGGIDLGVRYIVESLAGILPAGRLGRDRRPAPGLIQGAPGIACTAVRSTGRGLPPGTRFRAYDTDVAGQFTDGRFTLLPEYEPDQRVSW